MPVLQYVFSYSSNISVFLLYIMTHAFVRYAKLLYQRKGGYFNKHIPYEKSAQISRVLWRRKCFMMDITSSRDFLTTVGSNIHPDYVLKPSVSLYAITKDEAVFVETPDEIKLFRSDIHPFLYVAQFQYCQRVITMPIRSFHKLANDIGSSTAPVIWLSNTGRCGSTIIGQLFESVQGTILMSENDSLTNLAYMKEKGKVSGKEYEEIFSSIVRVLCKPRANINRVCIKCRSCGMVHMKFISKLFPHIKQMFLYRNVRPTVSSFLGLTVSETALAWWRYFADNELIVRFFPFLRNYLHSYFTLNDSDFMKASSDINTVEMFTSMWAKFILQAQNVKSHYKNILPVKYEDLISHPQKTCERIFEAVGIENAEVKTALKVLKSDSQRGSVLSKSSIGGHPRRSISSVDKLKADCILSKHQLPLMGEDFRL